MIADLVILAAAGASARATMLLIENGRVAGYAVAAQHGERYAALALNIGAKNGQDFRLCSGSGHFRVTPFVFRL